MNNHEIRHFEIEELRFATGDDTATRRLEGYAAVYNRDSVLLYEPPHGRFIERIAPGAFDKSLEEVTAGTRSIKALWSHERGRPLASTKSGRLSLRSDANGLWFSLDMQNMRPEERGIAEDGDLQMSFGMRNIKFDWSHNDAGERIRTITSADLFEVSPVAFPAYPDTTTAVRSLQEWEAGLAREAEEAERAEEAVKEDAEQLQRLQALRWEWFRRRLEE